MTDDDAPPELWWHRDHGVMLPTVADGVDYGWHVLGSATWLDERPRDAVRLIATPPSPTGEAGRDAPPLWWSPTGGLVLRRSLGGLSAIIEGTDGVRGMVDAIPADAVALTSAARRDAPAGSQAEGIVHRAPDGGMSPFNCCGLHPPNVPDVDRITWTDDLVTCEGG